MWLRCVHIWVVHVVRFLSSACNLLSMSVVRGVGVWLVAGWEVSG